MNLYATEVTKNIIDYIYLKINKQETFQIDKVINNITNNGQDSHLN